MPKTALITGITGQDGCYIAGILLKNGWKVCGTRRRGSSINNWRLVSEGIDDRIHWVDMDLMESTNVRHTLERINPSAIYNLAAMSFVGTSFEQPAYTHHVNCLGVIHLIEAIKSIGLDCKFYQASTSEMYGGSFGSSSCEDTPMNPRSPYAISKLAAYHTVRNFRMQGGFGVNGILFNHESKYRGVEFVTRKICVGLARYNLTKTPILLGNVHAERDWGHAFDYMLGAYKMMEHHTPDDWVLATGCKWSVKEFFDRAAYYLDHKTFWSSDDKLCYDDSTGEILAMVDESLWRPLEVDVLQGDATRAKEVLGWDDAHSFDDLVKEMAWAERVRADRGTSIQ